MKQVLPLQLLAILLFVFEAGTAQNAPVDFEAGGNGANWTWTVFENDTNPPLEIIANPDPGGINTSSTVAKFTALQSGNPFAGCETMHGADIGTFTIDSTNMIIRIMVWKSVISDVGIKLVRADNWSLGEIKIPNTLTNQWEQITFDFSSHLGLTYDQIVIFPDFDARSSDNVIYFDNVMGPVAVATDVSAEAGLDFDLYPNPTQGYCKLRSGRDMEEVKVINAAGQLVYAEKELGNAVELDLSTLPAGIFFLQVNIDGQILTDRIVRSE